MKFSIIVLLLACITMASCAKGFDCKWSSCEGITHSGRDICKRQGLGQFTGSLNKEGCKWDSERVQCCKVEPSRPACKFSARCYGIAYGASYVCRTEFGGTYKPERKIGCGGTLTRYECCLK